MAQPTFLVRFSFELNSLLTSTNNNRIYSPWKINLNKTLYLRIYRSRIESFSSQSINSDKETGESERIKAKGKGKDISPMHAGPRRSSRVKDRFFAAIYHAQVEGRCPPTCRSDVSRFSPRNKMPRGCNYTLPL